MFLKRCLMVVAVALAPALAFSQTVDFEDVPDYTKGSFVSGGFNVVATGFASVVYQGQYCGPKCPDNGTKMLLSPYGNFGNGQATVSMSKLGGGLFNLTGFDGAGSFNFASSDWNDPGLIPTHIDVVGSLAGGGVVFQSFAIDKSQNTNGTLNFTTYSVAGFSNLSSVSFTARGGNQAVYNGFTLDNITVTPVPEPETFALMLAGLGLLGGVARRRHLRNQ